MRLEELCARLSRRRASLRGTGSTARPADCRLHASAVVRKFVDGSRNPPRAQWPHLRRPAIGRIQLRSSARSRRFERAESQESVVFRLNRCLEMYRSGGLVIYVLIRRNLPGEAKPIRVRTNVRNITFPRHFRGALALTAAWRSDFIASIKTSACAATWIATGAREAKPRNGLIGKKAAPDEQAVKGRRLIAIELRIKRDQSRPQRAD